MQSLSLVGTKPDLEAVFRQVRALAPSIVFFFAAPDLLHDPAFVEALTAQAKGLTMIGCSTAGELTEHGIASGSFSLLAIAFGQTEVRVAHQAVASSHDTHFAAEALAEQLKGPKLKAVIVFGPGTEINGSAIVNGLRTALGPGVIISGGLAADEARFKMTATLCDEAVSSRDLVAVGFYGDHVSVSCGSEGGWRPFGPARKVTKAVDNILYELDNKPALQLYKLYLGDKARQLPASGLSYPFAVLRPDRTTSGVIRSALNIDDADESIILAGNIDEGARVCLMHADTAALTQGAAQAAAEALRTHDGVEEGGCALVVSCVGRKVVLGIDVDDEIEAVVDSFLPGIPVAGYYAYGEISTNSETGRTEMHNQTMTITYITETTGLAGKTGE